MLVKVWWKQICSYFGKNYILKGLLGIFKTRQNNGKLLLRLITLTTFVNVQLLKAELLDFNWNFKKSSPWFLFKNRREM